jgi:hypothetical protein
MYGFINNGSGTGTIDPSGTQKIDGHDTWTIPRNGSIIIVSNNADWNILAGHRHLIGSSLPTTGLYDGMVYDLLINGSVVHCCYNSTISKWLGPELIVAQHNYLNGPPFGATNETLATSLRNDKPLYLTRFTASYYTGGGVDASNYWRIYLRCLTSALGFNNIVYIQTDDNNWVKEADKVAADMSNILRKNA